MALNIKDPETDRLARALAAATGETITVATRRAIEERLTRVCARQAAAEWREDLLAIAHRGRNRSSLDEREIDSIIGYDERGLPTSVTGVDLGGAADAEEVDVSPT